MTKKPKTHEKPKIVQCDFRTDDLDTAIKIKHPANITGKRKRRRSQAAKKPKKSHPSSSMST